MSYVTLRVISSDLVLFGSLCVPLSCSLLTLLTATFRCPLMSLILNGKKKDSVTTLPESDVSVIVAALVPLHLPVVFAE